MVNNTEFYKILEVDKNATSEDIKRQYKKLAKKYHPDRNLNNKEEAEKNFKKLSKAYTVLSDPRQRKQYDMMGEDGINGGSQNMPDPFDIFSSMFGGNGNGFNPFNMGKRGQSRGPKKSETKQVKLNISLEDLYSGKKFNLDYSRKNKCSNCNGKGAENNDGFVDCNTCKGRGNITTIKQMGPFVQQITQVCNSCKGKCKSIKPGYECKVCNGSKIVKEKINIEVYINPGTADGEKIIFENKADWNPECELPGDFVIIICETYSKKNIFTRTGDNLIIHRNISIKEALIGFKFRIKHLDDRVLELEQSNIQHPDQVMCVKGEGMPKGKNDIGYGDLIIKFNIIFPNSLDEQRKIYLSKILPDLKLTKNDEELAKKENIECKKLETYNFNSSNKDNHNKYSNENDDLNNESVECTTQ